MGYMAMRQIAIRLDEDLLAALQERAAAARLQPCGLTTMARALLSTALGLDAPAASGRIPLTPAVTREEPPAPAPRRRAPQAVIPAGWPTKVPCPVSPRDLPDTEISCGHAHCGRKWLQCQCADKGARKAKARLAAENARLTTASAPEPPLPVAQVPAVPEPTQETPAW